MATPKTLLSSIQDKLATTFATSSVETFSPFHLNNDYSRLLKIVNYNNYIFFTKKCFLFSLIQSTKLFLNTLTLKLKYTACNFF